jgi:hypothetical protein
MALAAHHDNAGMKILQTVAIGFFGVIGLAVVGVVGSIAFNAYRNNGLIPPPSTLSRYACSGGNVAFEFFYLHGTDRVKIKSKAGLLEGKVRQNQLDWGSFSNDPTQLGFIPPAAITFEDSKGLRMGGSGMPAEIACTNTAVVDGGRRGIVQ